MVCIEVVIRDYLGVLNLRNTYPEREYPFNGKSDDFCRNGEKYRCFFAVNASTILGISISILQEIAIFIISALISKTNFVDKSNLILIDFIFGFFIRYFNTIVISVSVIKTY